jgi:hypothetical protein
METGSGTSGETRTGIARDLGATPTGRMGMRRAAGTLQPELLEGDSMAVGLADERDNAGR